MLLLPVHSSNAELPVVRDAAGIGVGYNPLAIAAAATDGDGPTSEHRGPFAFTIFFCGNPISEPPFVTDPLHREPCFPSQ